MKNLKLIDGIVLVLLLLPIIYLYNVYSILPASIATHFGMDGKPNGYTTREGFWGVQALLSGIVLFTYLLIRILPIIDPKKQAKYGEATYQKIALGISMFICALNIAIIYGALHSDFKIDRLLNPSLGLLFAFLGNLMNNVKPNYFVGIRTPWTLEDEGTWKATHRFAAKFWLIGGLLITVVALLIHGENNKPFMMPAILILAFVPIIYSYIYYKKHRPA